MNKEKLKSFNLKKWGIILLVAFLAIVTALTVSSKLLTDKAVSAVQTKEASTKAIISTSDENFEEELSSSELEYTKIGNTIYVVDYGTADKALKAVEQYEEVASVSAEEDAIFVTSANEGEDISDTEVSKVSETVPEGMTLRDYADSVGKKIVAVIDTGVDPDYAIASKNFTDEDDNDTNGHGTGIAKAILANANDKALILSLKAMHEDGTGYMSEIMQAVQYAREQHVDIINMSIATDASTEKQEFVNLVSQAIADGIKVVASAGNYSSNAMSYYPAGIDGVISVGAAEDNGIKKEFSNYNANYYVNANSTSEAAGIVSGLIAKGDDLSELINSSTMIMDSGDKYKEDVKIGDQFTVQGTYTFHFDGAGEATSSGSYSSYAGSSTGGTVTLYSSYTGGAISVPNKSGYSSSVWNCGGTELSNGSQSIAGKSFSYYSATGQNGSTGNLLNGTFQISCSFSRGTLNQTTYTVTYESNNGNISKTNESRTVTPGSSYSVQLPSASRDFYSCSGWYEGGTYIGAPGAWVTLSAGNHTLHPNWNPYKITVRFNGNGGNDAVNNVPGNQTFSYGINGTLASNTPTRTGYHLNGGSDNKFWNTRADGSGIRYNPGQATYMYQSWRADHWNQNGATIDLYAQWAVNHYTIYYNLNGGSGDSSSQYVAYTDTVTLHGTPSRTGYIFEGWHVGSVDGTRYNANQGVSKLTANDNGSVTLYAKWTPITYNVAFNSNGGTHVRYNNNSKSDQSVSKSNETNEYVGGSTTTTTYTYDQAKNLPANGFSWAGHTFLGWSTNPNATTATYGNSASIKNLSSTNNATVTLYAIWKTNAETLTINPVSGSGTWNGSSSSQKGQAETYVDGKGNTKWGDKVVLDNATAVDKSATITYNVQANDATIDRTSDTVKWVFSRWIQNSGAKGRIFNNSARANDGSHDGGANTYYIIQSANDTVTAAYYWQTVILPTPTREGYTFLGWYYDANCTDKVDGRGPGATKYPLDSNGVERTSEFQTTGNGGATFRTEGNVTLYARWQKNSYDYADTEYVFMQNDDDSTTGAFLRKVDASTLLPLKAVKNEGFTLEIYKNSISSSNLVLKLVTNQGLYNASGTKVANVTSDANGWYNITDYLANGTTYIVHESSAPRGYLLAKDQSFKFDSSKKTQITMADKTIYSPNDDELNITKVDAYGRAIAGAEFTLKDETTNSVVEKFTSDENGVIISYLPDYITAGHRYSLTETKAPEGYTIANVLYFTAPTYDGETLESMTVTENDKTAELQIYKVSGSDEKPLEGATFQVFMKDADGELIPCYMNKNTREWVEADEESENTVLMTGTTDSNGLVSFKKLPLRASYTGSEADYTKSYYIKEIQAPEGHSLLTEIAEVRLPDDGSTTFRYTATDDSVTLTLEAGGYGNQIVLFSGGSFIVIGLFLAMKKRMQRNAD